MTHGWKAMNPTIFLRPKKGGVICCHSAKKKIVITVHWNVWKISDLILVMRDNKHKIFLGEGKF